MINDFYRAWYYLCEHPYFRDKKYNYNHSVSVFPLCLEVEVHRINPRTKSIDEIDYLNTKNVIWLECGPQEFQESLGRYECIHDPELDCGGSTFEEAIINLANLVESTYPLSLYSLDKK